MEEIEYDPEKSEKNLQKRGIDFDKAAEIFNNTFVDLPGRPGTTEDRRRAIGYVDDVCITIIYTWHGEQRGIISARPARRQERDEYHHQNA